MTFGDSASIQRKSQPTPKQSEPKHKASRASKKSGVTNRAFAKKFSLHLAAKLNKWWVKRCGSDFLDQFDTEAAHLLAQMVREQKCQGKTLRATR